MKQWRILHIEDDPLWAQEVLAALKGFEVQHVASATEAKQATAKESFDIALIDLGLHGDQEAGLDLVRELKAQHPDLKIVVLSARKEPSSVKRSLRFGADDFVEKSSVGEGTLRVALERVLSFSRAASGIWIQTITLVQFKSWKEQRHLNLGRKLTFFSGPNSAGKSTALQALLLLKQTAESADRALPLQIGGTRAQHVDLGTFEDVAHSHKAESEITLGLSWFDTGRSRSVSFETTVGVQDQRLRVRRFHYEQQGARYGMELSGSSYLVFAEAEGESSSDVSHRPPVKCYGFPPEAIARLPPTAAERMRDFQLSFEQLMERIYYLQPLRERPSRVYTWTGERPGSVGVRGDRAIDALLAMDRDQEHFQLGSSETISAVEALNTSLRGLGLTESFRLERISPRQFEARIVPLGGDVEVGLADLGFGLSQVLPILVLGLYAQPGSVVLIEQPELHLHPAAQVGLGDILVELAKGRNLQFLIETHSEHLLLRIQRRIAEGAIKPADIRMYFCRRDKNSTEAEELRLDEYGEIENWPPGFFGDPTAEAAERMRAAFRRRRQEVDAAHG